MNALFLSLAPSTRRCLLLLASGLTLGALAGCPGGGYAAWPPADTSRAFNGEFSSNDVNRPPMLPAMATALNYACRRFPPVINATPEDVPTEPFAINLPPGTVWATAVEIAGYVHPMARPLTEETKSLPTYHIAAVNVRGTDAEATVMVPVLDFKSPKGGTLYKGVRIVMRSGTKNWTVMGHSSYPVSVLDVPQPNLLVRTPPELE